MSKSDDFLSRWSRRKQQAAQEAASPKNEGKAEQVDRAVASPASETSDTEPLFDLSKLPSLDSIGPDSDVSLFMQPGVPASLSRAALRRAWSADPAIRDFIGLSENSWDFTKPDSITGFGPLLPSDNVQKLLANIIGGGEADREQRQATALQQPDTEGQVEPAVSQGAEIDQDSVAVDVETQPRPEIVLQCTKNEPATQQTSEADHDLSPTVKRRHGGALPT